MENIERKEKDEVFSMAVKAGKRRYFFDVRETLAGDRYLTITESKRKFNDNDGSFSFEKHKIFLYKEDNEKFLSALKDTIHFIETGIEPIIEEEQIISNDISDLDSFDFDIKD
jgi:hypothetical protein